MTVAAPNRYLASLLAGQPQLPASPLAWFNDLRSHAVDRVGALSVPTTRDEEWRFTDISPLTGIPFHPVRGGSKPDIAQLAEFILTEAGARLVFVDGEYAPLLSFNNTGITVTSLASGLASHGTVIEPHLGRHTEFQSNAFAALNTAFLHDGAIVIAPRNVAVSAPLHVLHVATQKGAASYPRCLVIAEPGSVVTVVEEFVALQNDVYFTDAVTEIVLADGARVHHVRVQRESGQAFHVSNCAISLGRASHYQSVSVALGARISRCNLNVVQTAEGVECAIDGLALVAEQQLADTHTCIDHAQPHGVSRQLHKCIVDGAARAVFNGKILVRQGAQRTDSSQSSRNLLLTSKARVDTKPQLEIFADDVKCAHGATVGQLDSDEVFYLMSRGFPEAAARNLLTYAFGAEVISRIPVASLRHKLEQRVLAQTNSQSVSK